MCGAETNLGLVQLEIEGKKGTIKEEDGKARKHLTKALGSFFALHDQLGCCEALEAWACLHAKNYDWSKSSVSFRLSSSSRLLISHLDGHEILFGAAKELRSVIHAHVPLSRAGHYEKCIRWVAFIFTLLNNDPPSDKKEIEKHLSENEIGKLEQQGAKMELASLIAYVLA